MNQKTAKFLRSIAGFTNSSYRELKRGWNKISHNNKAQVRENLKNAVRLAIARRSSNV